MFILELDPCEYSRYPYIPIDIYKHVISRYQYTNGKIQLLMGLIQL